MQIGTPNLAEWVSTAFSVSCLIVALWTRAAVAELRANLAERQEQRCKACKEELVSRREFEQFEKLIPARQGAESRG